MTKLTTVYCLFGRSTRMWARSWGENGWSLPAKLLLELGIGDVAPEDDGVLQEGLGSAEDVEHAAGLLSNLLLSFFKNSFRVVNSVSLFFKSKHSFKKITSQGIIIYAVCKQLENNGKIKKSVDERAITHDIWYPLGINVNIKPGQSQ